MNANKMIYLSSQHQSHTLTFIAFVASLIIFFFVLYIDVRLFYFLNIIFLFVQLSSLLTESRRSGRAFRLPTLLSRPSPSSRPSSFSAESNRSQSRSRYQQQEIPHQQMESGNKKFIPNNKNKNNSYKQHTSATATTSSSSSSIQSPPIPLIKQNKYSPRPILDSTQPIQTNIHPATPILPNLPFISKPKSNNPTLSERTTMSQSNK